MDFANLTGQLGVTPKTTIYARGTLKLHHFTPVCEEVYRVPVLIVTSLVNQPYILDLVPGQSMVEFLLKKGFDVYMIEWGRPRKEHRNLSLEDHVLDRLPACVNKVLSHSGESQLSIIGYCVGGLLAVLWAAIDAAMRGKVSAGPLKILFAWQHPLTAMAWNRSKHGWALTLTRRRFLRSMAMYRLNRYKMHCDHLDPLAKWQVPLIF